MERTCKTCDRIFSTPYNLRQHYQRFHPLESQPKLLRMSRKVYPQKGAKDPLKLERMQRSKIENQVNQYGGGDIFSTRSDSDDEGSDGEDGDSMTNNDGSDNDSESAMEDDEEDESKVFGFFVRQAKNELEKDGIHEVSRELLQEKFRELLISFLNWKDRLNKNSIYKKVMANVRDLQDEQFDRQEAIEAAVHKRRFLLNRVVLDIDDSDDDEEEIGEDSETEDNDEGTGDSGDVDQ